MLNDSSTGGPLAPIGDGPLEGEALDNFIHDLVAGITGIDNTLVFPRWQAEPPNIPKETQAWCAVGITERPSDTFPYVRHIGTDGGTDNLQRHERLEILASFYALGAGSVADSLAAILRDGFSIAQNREVLALNSFAFVACGTPIAVPSLLKERWNYRVDLPFQLRRAISRTYPVRNLVAAEVDLVTENPHATRTIHIGPTTGDHT